MQWHPLFAHLLRPLMQEHYAVQTDVPVGDLPRAADIVLLRRTSAGPTPFRRIWRHLTAWNVLEFKGPTSDPRLHDPDLLIEVGLGVERRLNDEEERQQRSRQRRENVSFWYLANHVGRRFRLEVEQLLGKAPTPLGDGLWRYPCLGRCLFLVSNDMLPVDRESVPLHLVSRERKERQHDLIEQVLAEPSLRRAYIAWLLYLHPELWEEAERMAKTMKTPLKREFDLNALIEHVGIKKVIDRLGLKRVLNEVGIERILNELSPEQREELRRRLQ